MCCNTIIATAAIAACIPEEIRYAQESAKDPFMQRIGATVGGIQDAIENAAMPGLLARTMAIRASRQGQQWGLLAFQGLASIGAGVIAFLWPTITVLAFVLLIAAWSIVSGVVFVAVAFRVDTSRERWWLMLGGVTSLVFGVLRVLAALLEALVLTWWLGTYTLVIGVALMVLAFRLRSRGYHRPAGFAPRRAA